SRPLPFTHPPTTGSSTLSLHDALPIFDGDVDALVRYPARLIRLGGVDGVHPAGDELLGEADELAFPDTDPQEPPEPGAPCSRASETERLGRRLPHRNVIAMGGDSFGAEGDHDVGPRLHQELGDPAHELLPRYVGDAA